MIEAGNQPPGASRPSWWIYIAPFIVMAVIFGFSSRSQLPDLDGGRDFQNVVGHFVVYAALGATLTLLFRSLGWSARRALLFAIVISTLYGVSDEFHQSFVPNRNVDAKDVLDDFLGATSGSLVTLRMLAWRDANETSDAAQDQPAGENS
jgi:VanZ family protein